MYKINYLGGIDLKKYQIITLAIIVLIGALFVPKMLKGSDNQVKFKVVSEEDVPEQITEMLPKYLMEERALTCKYKDEIYVIVTRGEKNSKGYEVDIEGMTKEKYTKEVYDLVVYAKFMDPDPNEIVEQEYDYPFIVVKTNLKNMPEEVHLDIEYKD
jgi:hypothetical protein